MKKCKKCGHELKNDQMYCTNCGNAYENNNIQNKGLLNLKKHSQNYNSIAWFIIILGFILGIVFGNVFMKVEINSLISGNYEYTFNFGVMLITWAISILSGLIIMGIGSICHRLDLILENK